jgi:hypothetical protein
VSGSNALRPVEVGGGLTTFGRLHPDSFPLLASLATIVIVNWPLAVLFMPYYTADAFSDWLLAGTLMIPLVSAGLWQIVARRAPLESPFVFVILGVLSMGTLVVVLAYGQAMFSVRASEHTGRTTAPLVEMQSDGVVRWENVSLAGELANGRLERLPSVFPGLEKFEKTCMAPLLSRDGSSALSIAAWMVRTQRIDLGVEEGCEKEFSRLSSATMFAYRIQNPETALLSLANMIVVANPHLAPGHDNFLKIMKPRTPPATEVYALWAAIMVAMNGIGLFIVLRRRS